MHVEIGQGLAGKNRWRLPFTFLGGCSCGRVYIFLCKHCVIVCDVFIAEIIIFVQNEILQ